LGAVLLVALAATPFAIKAYEAHVENERLARELFVQESYEIQNQAFWDSSQKTYLPYQQARENILQIHLNAYAYYTGETVTRQDVEAFLATGMNADGTPITWENEDAGTIKGFVIWCADHNTENLIYRAKITDIFIDYLLENPDCSYRDIGDLSAEQIMQLDAKLNDPAYDLDLEVAR
jgi:hypothetical protein